MLKNPRWSLLALIVLSPAAQAEGPRPPASAPAAAAAAAPSGTAQKLDVNTLKQRYWNQGEANLRVVQNRMFTKAGRLNIEPLAGVYSNDPFLSSISYGGTLGFNFSETFAIQALYWRVSNKDSPAVQALVDAEEDAGAPGFGPNYNPVKSVLGGELSFGLLYGKLSLLGASILHFDFFLLGGGGIVQANNGNSVAFWPGVGQQIYLAKWVALRVDYRMLIYSEQVKELNRPATLGKVLNTRTAFAGAFNLGFNLYLF